jgi:predicted HAD superfamily Cof-like phosphohydrolase
MQKELKLVAEFHRKFKVPVAEKPILLERERAKFRYELMREEVEEYLTDGVESGKVSDIAKELADILYAVYGTILEHGLQNKMEEILTEVHRSQMSKDYSPTKMIKGDKYREADTGKILKNNI